MANYQYQRLGENCLLKIKVYSVVPPLPKIEVEELLPQIKKIQEIKLRYVAYNLKFGIGWFRLCRLDGSCLISLQKTYMTTREAEYLLYAGSMTRTIHMLDGTLEKELTKYRLVQEDKKTYLEVYHALETLFTGGYGFFAINGSIDVCFSPAPAADKVLFQYPSE